MNADAAALLLKIGDPRGALARLQEQVREQPGDARLRIFLFQLLCVTGQWERARSQLTVASELDPQAVVMAQMYHDAILCEGVRARVFAGQTAPMVFGEPDEWLALLVEALLADGRGEKSRSIDLRARALEQAPASGGDVDGKRFSWICDADSRLGPVLEAVVNGRYYWIPFARLTKVQLEPPEDLRDLVWMPARLQFEHGGEAVALLPARYAGSEASDEGAIVLARKTVWSEIAPQTFSGLGQRVLATDADEIPLMEVRDITLEGVETDAAAPQPSGTASGREPSG
jgi:type VI secretion system protein ImpE